MANYTNKEQPSKQIKAKESDYLYSMSHAPRISEDTHIGQMFPIIVFSSIIILIVRMYSYNRPMEQFFWTSQTNATDIVDFFSYYKMVIIIICAVIALLMLLYQIVTQSLAIKSCFAYIPMAVYTLFVILSYTFSNYKEFAWLGWNDRFEGTLPLLGYMVLLFFVINSIKSEKNVKMVLYPLATSSIVLSLLGISQALGHDFFRTTLGQKLIVPNFLTDSGITTWQGIESAAEQGKQYLEFTFKNKEIYQTVYNINYVSFYLTLLIPLFGMLFIRALNKNSKERLWKKVGLGVLFALLIYNLIGSASSGGILGLGVIGVTGLIVLNKRLLHWAKPLTILFIITGIVASITVSRWLPEIKNATFGDNGIFNSVAQENDQELQTNQTQKPASIKPFIDYIITNENNIEISINHNPLTIQVTTDKEGVLDGLILLDEEEKALPMYAIEAEPGVYSIGDDRFYQYLTLTHAFDKTYYYVILKTIDIEWAFQISGDQIYYYNQLGRTVSLYNVAHFGFEHNPDFGSQRGFIWSRTFPLLKDTLILGTGADTYCAVFPQEDYAGKYSNNFQGVLNMIIDKPHNMYLHAAVGTGGISLLALLALYGIYLTQSFRLYRKTKFENDYLTFVGAGIFFGVTGFIATGLVDDSSVSVMPMFYTLLGMGIAINLILKRRNRIIES